MSSSVLAFALPAAAVAVLHVLMLAAAAFDRHPFWRTHEINLSEAAALHDAGEVVRLIERGEDPHRPRDVRAGLIDGQARRLTPFEAAVAEDRPEIIALLLQNGAVLTPQAWTRLRCFAERMDAGDARQFLDSVRPPAAQEACDGVAMPAMDR